MERWYVLNAVNQTLATGYNAQQPHAQVTELRRCRILSVDTNLRRELPSDYEKYFPKSKGKLTLPTDRTEPFGVTFSDGTMMLLWARPGKDFKVWTRAFTRFMISTAEDDLDRSKTAWLVQRSDNNFVLSLYRCLIPTVPLNTQFIETLEVKTVQGWLCKTSHAAPADVDQSPFVKAYCVLDLQKLELLLKTKDNGTVVEKVQLRDRLTGVDTGLIGKIDEHRQHPVAEQRLLEGVQMPIRSAIPFALFFNDGELLLLWASSKEDYVKWKFIFEQLIPPEISESYVKYGLKTKANAFLTTLYTSLVRSSSEQEILGEDTETRQKQELKGTLFEAVRTLEEIGSDNKIFTSSLCELDVKNQLLKIFDRDNPSEVAEEIIF